MSNAKPSPIGSEDRRARILEVVAVTQAAIAHIDPNHSWSEELIAERRAEALRDLMDDEIGR